MHMAEHSVSGCGDGMFTREEVAQHNKANDLWIIHDGTVHDMTSFVNEHPGGKAILNKAGQDATKVLHTFSPHVKAADFVMKKLNEACIGVLVQ
ncbi:unnamed protein product [Anisakis simplex]|uniref:Cytochrome b5 heme-binding domain-containing protein n=1 Tax=Anisakis simplex TaxID=6269 RepID=A0A0M3K0S9_ANISI|nr:unnamed protein product [Anisakis simplex]